MRKIKLFSLLAATALFVGLYACSSGNATKEEVKEVEKEVVEEAPVAVSDSAAVVEADSAVVEEPVVDSTATEEAM